VPGPEGIYEGTRRVEPKNGSESSIPAIDAHTQKEGIYEGRGASMDEAEAERLLAIGQQLGLTEGGES
jgi:hypothetical protein